MIDVSLAVVICIVIVALIFDYINGFHDSANSIATIVSTQVLKPPQAVVWAAFFNFVAVFLFDAQVAKTIGTGIISTSIVSTTLIISALGGPIIWNC
jgi:PiT family inorganic phosphate transporter